MPVLSEWLKVMLGEIARKREDAERAREEDVRRQQEDSQSDGASTKPPVPGQT
jgi:septal ring factor EnvC (AmiA/AmiB activator)